MRHKRVSESGGNSLDRTYKKCQSTSRVFKKSTSFLYRIIDRKIKS